MAADFVDGLEVVEVEHGQAQRHRGVMLCACNGGGEQVLEFTAVQQACERVAAGAPLVVLEHARIVERYRGVVGERDQLLARVHA